MRIAAVFLAIVLSSCASDWQPLKSIAGASRRNVVGDPSQPGPFRYQLRIPAGARIAAHRHSVDVHGKVLKGSMFIVLDESLDPSRARHFVAGNTFVVPANAWHIEWWDEESVLEAEGVGPMVTTYRE